VKKNPDIGTSEVFPYFRMCDGSSELFKKEAVDKGLIEY
jgi:hypothetical protein